jgi:CTP:molybdopterin cytidylyltransferase MocA
MENNPIFILLAGGKSERMGVDKGLLKYKQTFWILEQLRRISESNISTVYIGLGYNYEHYFNAISWLKSAQDSLFQFEGLSIQVVLNRLPEKGPFSTLQNVLKNIQIESDVVLSPIDTPILSSKELNKIISEQNSVVIPNFEGENGHPIKINYKFWKNLCNLDLNDKSSRLDFQIKKINSIQISKIEVLDREVILNINTKKDWINYLKNN